MSKRDLKALGASVVNTSRRLELRSGTTARTERMAEEQNDDLEALGRVQELEQKLEMAEQAVNEKDKEIEAKNAEMEEMRRQAESELQEARELADDLKKTLEQERTDAKLLEAELERLTAVGERMETEMRDRENQQELQRLRQVEQLRQQFDKERERHREEMDRNAALVATLQKELEASKATSESPCRESESGGGSSKKKSVTFAEPEDESRGQELAPVVTQSVSGDGNGSPSETTTVSEGGGGNSPSGQSSTTSDSVAPPGSNLSSEHGVASDPGGVQTQSVVSAAGVALSGSSSNSDQLMQSLAQLVKTQTDMVAAQTRAMSAQTLPPMTHFSGEGLQSGEDGFDRWLEQFDERAKLVGWSEDHKKYQLKMLLDRNAFQAYRLLPESVKSSYKNTVEALQKRFKPVDIEELRGLEFHQLTQVSQSVEQLGIQLQKLAKRAFPALEGRDLDRLLKGRFFQALLRKWQRKLGAPKAEESFDELYSRARMTECRDKQYAEAAGERRQTPQKRENDSRNEVAQPEDRDKSQDSGARGRGVQCNACHKFGHIARYCPNKRGRSSEAPGRSEPPARVLAAVTDAELESEIARRKLDREEQLLETSTESSIKVVTGAVGPTLLLEVSVGGVPVSAVVDTGAQSTIISRSLLHRIRDHLKAKEESMPKLRLPSPRLYGKSGAEIDPACMARVVRRLT